MRRRDFVALIGACAAWPLSRALAQQHARKRVIGVLMANAEGDLEGQERVSLLRTRLEELGWSEGLQVQFDVRWHAGDLNKAKWLADELMARSPDLLVANGTQALSAVQQLTRTVPIIFVVVNNPVGAGFVQNLAHPGGNATGFSTFEPEIAGKWIELLAHLQVGITNVGVLLDPALNGLLELVEAIERVAQSLRMRIIPLRATDGTELDAVVKELATHGRPGLIALPTPTNTANRSRIFERAAQYRIPAVYPFSSYARQGGLLAYGFDSHDLFRRAAVYVARILNGEEPRDLPVQAPTKFELVINLKTASALDLTIPPTLLARADELIE